MFEKVNRVNSAFGQLTAGAIFGSNLNHTYRLILLVSQLAAQALKADAGSI